MEARILQIPKSCPLPPDSAFLCRYLFTEIRLDLTHFLVFHWQKLGAAPGTCYFLWFHLGQSSKRAEPIVNNGVKILRTTDESDRLVIRIIPFLPWSNQNCFIVCALMYNFPISPVFSNLFFLLPSAHPETGCCCLLLLGKNSLIPRIKNNIPSISSIVPRVYVALKMMSELNSTEGSFMWHHYDLSS